MPDTKVFLSSTYRDLAEHRKAVIERLRRLDDVSVVCMEEFGARADHPTVVCQQKLEPCDLYVGVFGCYYGSVPKGGGCSMTELEFRTAIDKGKPRLIFVSDDDFRAPANLHQSKKNFNRQQALRREAMAELTVETFRNDPDKLANAVVAAVTNWRKKRKKRKRTPSKPAPAPAPTPRTAPLHQLPSDIPDFTGRTKELDTLLTALERDGATTAVVTAIKGMGGVGKTALAVHAARRLLARYPDAQIVVNLQGYGEAEPLKPIDAMAKLVQAFEPSFKPVDDLGQMTAHYRSVLDGKRALILLDNAPAGADLRPLVPPPPCGLIVTARDRVHVDGAKPIALGLLARPESVALLRAASQRTDVTETEWERIAELCGDLPLALRVAGTYLREAVNQTAFDYLAALADERTRLDALRLGDLPDRNVGAVLGHSARALVQRDAEAAARWQMLTVFPADFDYEAAAAVWEVEPLEAGKSLTDLFMSALLLFDRDERRYRLHDLLRPIARHAFVLAGAVDEGKESEKRLFIATMRHARHFVGILTDANRLLLEGGNNVLVGLNLYDLEAQNISSATTWAIENSQKSIEATEITAWLPNAGPHILNLRLNPNQAIKWLHAAVHAARIIDQPKLEGAHRCNLGNYYALIREFQKAIKEYRQALTIARKLGDRQGEASYLGAIGIVYADLRKSDRAIENFGEALIIQREISDERGEGTTLGALASVYADLGEPLLALELYEQSLAIYRKIGDLNGESTTLGNIGSTYALLGEFRRAIEHYEQALPIARTTGNRRGEGIHLAGIGYACAALGEMRRAIEFGETALAIFMEIESPDAATLRTWLTKWRAT